MSSKVFTAVVFLLWISTTGWLMVAKILPNYIQGEAPREGVGERLRPAAWQIELNGQPCGVSVSQTVPGVMGSHEIHSRVRLEKLPLAKVAPAWMLGNLDGLGKLSLEIRHMTTLDSLGQMSSFQTRVNVNGIPSVIKLDGRIEDGKLRLTLESGDDSHETEQPWRGGDIASGELSPSPRLLDAYPGRRWREEVYSPFSLPGSSAEVLEAEVLPVERVHFDGQLVRAKKIVYRTVTSAGVSDKNRIRSVVWVRDDGQVLRQETNFMTLRLRLTRLPSEKAASMASEMLELVRYSSSHAGDGA